MSKLTARLVNRMIRAGYDIHLTSDNQRIYLWLGNDIVAWRDKK